MFTFDIVQIKYFKKDCVLDSRVFFNNLTVYEIRIECDEMKNRRVTYSSIQINKIQGSV